MDWNLTNVGWFAAIAGGSTLIATAWVQIKQFWARTASYVIQTVVFYDTGFDSKQAMLLWLQRNTRPGRFRSRVMAFWRMRISKTGRTELAAGEHLRHLLEKEPFRWYGFWPIWAKSDYSSITLTFFHGTVAIDNIVREATAHINALQFAAEEKRHYVRVLRQTDAFKLAFGGSSGPQQPGKAGNDPSGSTPQASDRAISASSQIMLRDTTDWVTHSADEFAIGLCGSAGVSDVALPDEGQDLLAEFDAWLRAEDWYRERGLAYRRSWLFYGPPGTGKTATIRAMAVEKDVPLFLIDLNGCTNADLAVLWEEAKSAAPAIVVFEDLDTAFHGRESRTSAREAEATEGMSMGHRAPLSFDGFLQCLDGVIRSHGILTVITTNKPEKLDAALAEWDPEKRQMRCRPGRVDRAVYFGDLSPTGRMKIARKILRDLTPDEFDEAIRNSTPYRTGAEFEGYCCQLALARLEQTFASARTAKSGESIELRTDRGAALDARQCACTELQPSAG